MKKMTWRSAIVQSVRVAMLAGGVALFGASSAQALDCGPTGCGPTTCGPTCSDCDQVFKNAGTKLSADLARLTAECCAPQTCCEVADPCCEVADPCCDLGCGDGCGLGSCDTCMFNDGNPWTLQDALLSECSPISIGGWVQAGYHSGDTGLFNSNPDRVNLHQTWLYAEKVADGSCGVDWGFRADLMYGTDADDTQAFGNNPGEWDFANGWDRGGGYGWAMPQLYGEIASGDLSVKVGHFYTLLGYEVVTAPDNFFYSHAMTMYNSEAFTHTGALATYGVSDNLEVYAGWTLGWDTGFDQNNQGNSFLGGFSYSVTDNLAAIYIVTAGNFGALGRDAYSHSIVLDWAISDKLNYVFQSDLLRVGSTQSETIGVNQYLFYNINDCLALGGRVEWWKSDGVDNEVYTYGLNIKPHANLTIRPEVRHQNNTPSIGVNDDTVFGIDAILTF